MDSEDVSLQFNEMTRDDKVAGEFFLCAAGVESTINGGD